MSQWSSAKAKRVLAALLRIGWNIKRESSSHKILSRSGWPDVVFAFHDKDEIGPKMLARMAKHTGLEPKDTTLRRNGSVNGRFALERKKKAHLRRKLRWLNGLTAPEHI